MLNGSTYIVRPCMQPLKSSFSFLRIVERIYPVVRRTGAVLRQRADERAVFHARDIARVGTRVVTARPQILVQLDEGAAGDHLLAETVVFFLGSIHPMNRWRAW